jgi:hypothetical protein
MSTAQIIFAVLALLGVGAFLPWLGRTILDFLKGKAQSDISLILADKETYAKQLARVEKQADDMFLEIRRLQDDYTNLAIAKGIAEYERDQGLKREKELNERIDELEGKHQVTK